MGHESVFMCVGHQGGMGKSTIKTKQRLIWCLCSYAIRSISIQKWISLGGFESGGAALKSEKTIKDGFRIDFPNRFDMTLAVAKASSKAKTKPNLDMTLAVAEALSPTKPNLDMTLAVAEALSPNKPNLDMTLTVAEVLSPTKPRYDPGCC